MADQLLRLVITGDVSSATRELNKMKRELKSTINTAGQMSRGLLIGGAALGAGLALLAVKAGEAQVAHEKLLNTLQNNEQLAARGVAVFEAQAAAIQSMSAADDEAVMSAQAMLGQFSLTADEVLQLTPLVTDLSRKMGIDMASAAKMVGKAMAGTVGGLQKAGIVVDKTAYKTDRLGAVTDALRKSVGGFAEQELKTLPGALANLQNQISDLMENAGKPLAEMFTRYARQVSEVTREIAQWVAKNPELARTVADVTVKVAGFLLVAGGIAWVVKQIAALKLAFITLISVSAWTRLVAAIGEAVVGMQLYVAGAGVAEVATLGLAAKIGALTLAAGKLLIPLAALAVLFRTDEVTSYQEAVFGLEGGMKDLNQRVAEGRTTWADAQKAIENGTWANMTAEQKASIAAAALKDEADNADLLAGGMDGAATATHGYTDELIYLDNYLSKSQTAEATALEAKIAAKRAQDDYNAAVKKYGKNSDEARLARLRLTEAENKSRDATNVSAGAAAEAKTKVNNLATAWGNAADKIGRYVKNAGKLTPGERNAAVGAAVGKDGRILGFDIGGIASGPSTGYRAILHGTEAVLPLNNPRRYMQVREQADRRMGVARAATVVINNYAQGTTGGMLVQQFNAALTQAGNKAGYRAVMGVTG